MKIAVLEFPGSNCDKDCEKALDQVFGIKVLRVWHQEYSLPKCDGIIIPGGFTYGDYLRAGHLASVNSLMVEVVKFAKQGVPILGICNGFQILTESGLLPGSLLRNASSRFVCRPCHLRLGEGSSVYHKALASLKELRLPIAHEQGRYYACKKTMANLEKNGQILFRYVENPNGSVGDIAGICSANGRIAGMMPHPERATSKLLGSQDGTQVLGAFLASIS